MELDKRKARIAEIIFEFVAAGFEVNIAKQWIEVKEAFKSKSRDKWEVKTVCSSVGSWNYWEEEGNSLDIMLDSLKKWRKDLLENKEYPLSQERPIILHTEEKEV